MPDIGETALVVGTVWYFFPYGFFVLHWLLVIALALLIFHLFQRRRLPLVVLIAMAVAALASLAWGRLGRFAGLAAWELQAPLFGANPWQGRWFAHVPRFGLWPCIYFIAAGVFAWHLAPGLAAWAILRVRQNDHAISLIAYMRLSIVLVALIASSLLLALGLHNGGV